MRLNGPLQVGILAVKGDFEMFGRFHRRSLRCVYNLGRSYISGLSQTSFVVSLVSRHRVISKIYDTLHTGSLKSGRVKVKVKGTGHEEPHGASTTRGSRRV